MTMKTPFTILSESYDYIVDRAQRNVLFWDILRKRGNEYLKHYEAGQPPVLVFDYEMVLDGRTFEHPVNYALVRILNRRREGGPEPVVRDKERRVTRHGKLLDEKGKPCRPIVVIDPRAGHGPGIGGSKLNSQIGVALDYGHPVYFILFYTNPEAGQTIARVQQAEVRFLEEVASRHPGAPKPAVIGNCQAGWAAALIGADRPDVTGPLVFNGSPLSYWGGVEGANPMRYRGGLFGGAWLTSLSCDLGNGWFDGAHLVAGFEDLNPANTYWTKLYHLWTNVDTEEKRFLDFEKWWGGFYKMTAEEIHFIVDSLFIGNDLEQGQLRLDETTVVNLKNFKDPILVFASGGDNITPPPQALNWIYKVYGSTEEIKRCGQVIIYMVHPDVGHLGIFVSGKVARKEHRQILGNLGWLEYLTPGLYEMVIEKGSGTKIQDDYEVRFEAREMSDLLKLDDGLEDEDAFLPANGISKFNDFLYRNVASPWIKLAVKPPVDSWIRLLHPLRMQRYLVSDRNPLCWPVKWAAEPVKAQRRTTAPDNTFEAWEDIFSESMKIGLNYYRDMRDTSQEFVFKSIYGNPWLKHMYGTSLPAGETKAPTTPMEAPPMETVPVETAPVDAAPVDAAPVDAAPVDAAPVDAAPVDDAPVDDAPVDDAPVDAAPVDDAPVDAVPVDAAPKKADPKKAQPKKPRRKMARGGYVEAFVRTLIAVIGADDKTYVRELEMAENILQKDEKLRSVNPEDYKAIVKKQAQILEKDLDQALADLPKMVRFIKDRKRLFGIAKTMVSADGRKPDKKEKAMLTAIEKALRIAK